MKMFMGVPHLKRNLYPRIEPDRSHFGKVNASGEPQPVHPRRKLRSFIKHLPASPVRVRPVGSQRSPSVRLSETLEHDLDPCRRAPLLDVQDMSRNSHLFPSQPASQPKPSDPPLLLNRLMQLFLGRPPHSALECD